ncbi:MAG TPA: glycosyltransferase family 2 protein [Gaiellaceae bacterium]|nr:glycosyltransferase family 2 protein [Gaiellaceae bacterium]
MTKVAAVVLSWNGREDTLACLRSLEGEDVDVIVVDNASEDGTAEAVTGAEVIRNERNLGYAGGMNVGIRRALALGADAVLLLNNDVEVEPGAIHALAAAAEGAGAVCPVVVFGHDPDRVWYSGANFNPRRGYNGRQLTDWIDTPTATDRICGAAVLIPRTALEAVGTFDEDLFAYAEDADWSLRARKLGLPLLVVPDGTVRHKVSASTGGEGSPDALYYSTRNLLAVCERHAPLGALGTWRRRLVAIAALLAQAVTGKRRRAGVKAVLEGWRDFRRGRFGPRR